ncbi:hypothetical protein SAMN05446037_101010 [Anaerovirgula multivorans]|uniref:Uncharacterized protein n=1 Tax=Anaerovirgula multivorans TaxID=312168 RepID=A0A239EHU7_9FIRM|nr:hypothetical protein [Anaerovirgula multivorans]SNS43464.1 hypothetical protein SAMN05446037_101010 [Anaerovirgula multivorans]
MAEMFFRIYKNEDKERVLDLYNKMYQQFIMFERNEDYLKSLMSRPDIVDEGVIVGELGGMVSAFIVLAVNEVENLREGRVLELVINTDVEIDIEYLYRYIENSFKEKNVDMIVTPNLFFVKESNRCNDWLELRDHMFMTYPLNIKEMIEDTIKYNDTEAVWLNKKIVFNTEKGKFQIYLQDNDIKEDIDQSNIVNLEITTTIGVLWGIMLKQITVTKALAKRKVKMPILQIADCHKLLNSIVLKKDFLLTFADHF